MVEMAIVGTVISFQCELNATVWWQCFPPSAKCKSVNKQHGILPDTPGDLTRASQYS